MNAKHIEVAVEQLLLDTPAPNFNCVKNAVEDLLGMLGFDVHIVEDYGIVPNFDNDGTTTEKYILVKIKKK